MATSKPHTDAYLKVQEYVDTLPPWSKKICIKLREIILGMDSEIVENWKWGPNYNLNGMLCGFGAFKKHVNFVFFQGTLLRDKHNILLANPNNVRDKHLRFTNLKEVDEALIREYLAEAIENNKQGKKVLQADDQTVALAPDIQREFKSGGVLNYFNSLTYTQRKDYINWIADAKKDETRKNCIIKAVEMLNNKETLNKSYKA